MTDAEKLKGMKREEVQALAKKLGVNAGGKTEEIIARIQEADAAILCTFRLLFYFSISATRAATNSAARSFFTW